MQSLSTGERAILINGGRDARYVAGGYLVYGLKGSLLAVRLDVRTRQTAGTAVSVVGSVTDAGTITGAVEFDVSDSGTLVYVPLSAPERVALTWVDRQGREDGVPVEARPYSNPRVSPDGTRIAVEVQEGSDTNVWVSNTRSVFTPLTRESGEDSFPQWSPDGQQVVYFSARNGGGLFLRAADGAGTEQRIVQGSEWRPSSWTSDGRIVCEQFSLGQIFVRSPDDGSPEKGLTLVDDPAYFDVLHPSVSPDGRWLAYHSMESGTLEVYVRPFPDIQANKWRISSNGGYSPVWSRNGDELYYITGGSPNRARPVRQPDLAMMAVHVDTRPAFSAERSRAAVRASELRVSDAARAPFRRGARRAVSPAQRHDRLQCARRSAD